MGRYKQHTILKNLQYENKCKYCLYFNGSNCLSRTPEMEACPNFKEGDIITNLCQGGNKQEETILRETMKSRIKAPYFMCFLMAITVLGFEAVAVCFSSNMVLALVLNISLGLAVFCGLYSVGCKLSIVEEIKTRDVQYRIKAIVFALIYLLALGVYQKIGNPEEVQSASMIIVMSVVGAFPVLIADIYYTLVIKRNRQLHRKGHWVFTRKSADGMYNFIKIYDNEDEEQVLRQILAGYENFPEGIQEAANMIVGTGGQLGKAVYGQSLNDKMDGAIGFKDGAVQIKDVLDEIYHQPLEQNETGGYNGVENQYKGINQ